MGNCSNKQDPGYLDITQKFNYPSQAYRSSYEVWSKSSHVITLYGTNYILKYHRFSPDYSQMTLTIDPNHLGEFRLNQKDDKIVSVQRGSLVIPCNIKVKKFNQLIRRNSPFPEVPVLSDNVGDKSSCHQRSFYFSAPDIYTVCQDFFHLHRWVSDSSEITVKIEDQYDSLTMKINLNPQGRYQGIFNYDIVWAHRKIKKVKDVLYYG